MSKEFLKPSDLSDEELSKGENWEKDEEEDNKEIKKDSYQPQWPHILNDKSDKSGNIALRKEIEEQEKKAA